MTAPILVEQNSKFTKSFKETVNRFQSLSEDKKQDYKHKNNLHKQEKPKMQFDDYLKSLRKHLKDTFYPTIVETNLEYLKNLYEDLELTVSHQANLLEENKQTIDSMQAEIDRLMLEHCPNEMTPSQVKEWEKHQISVDKRVIK